MKLMLTYWQLSTVAGQRSFSTALQPPPNTEEPWIHFVLPERWVMRNGTVQIFGGDQQGQLSVCGQVAEKQTRAKIRVVVQGVGRVGPLLHTESLRQPSECFGHNLPVQEFANAFKIMAFLCTSCNSSNHLVHWASTSIVSASLHVKRSICAPSYAHFLGVVCDENPLVRFFDTNRGKVLTKWPQYFPVYHRYLSRLRHLNRNWTMLEIGAFMGGSAAMWIEYFGPRLKYWAIDNDPRAIDRVGHLGRVIVGDQSDPEVLRKVCRAVQHDLLFVIDDGSHIAEHMIASFEHLFQCLADGGIYIVEDTMVDLGNPGRPSFLDYVHDLSRQVNFMAMRRYRSERTHLDYGPFAGKIASITISNGIVVIEKWSHSFEDIRDLHSPIVAERRNLARALGF